MIVCVLEVGVRGLRPFQDFFTYIKPIVHQMWTNIEEPREKPPNLL